MRFKYTNHDGESAHVDLTPLIDVVFILLIFFILSATFTEHKQLDITRPGAATEDSSDATALIISIDRQEQVWFEDKLVGADSLRNVIAKRLSTQNTTSAIVNADENTSTRKLIAVIDSVRIAGVSHVAVATEKQ